jgi:formimidoylglutamate deiminase
MTAHRFALPGFVDAHSHAFQRALRGRSEGGDFWAWREAMLLEAARQTPETVRRDYEAVYRELRWAGYTAVGEFHYLGLPEARAAVEAAAEAEIEIVLLLAAYARGGIPRFRQRSAAEFLGQVEKLRAAGVKVGVAPHSVRACPAEWLEEIGAYAAAERLPLHVHADEQPREVEECLAEHGVRPIELLARTGCLGPTTTVVHATHADGHELDLLGDAGARVCICPTTEANLGDGYAPVEALLERGVGICIGSDSNVRIDPLEELRELEGIARRSSGRRNVIPIGTLLAFGSAEGAAALGLERWADVSADLAHPSLAGIRPEDVPSALVFGCSAEVFASRRAARAGRGASA